MTATQAIDVGGKLIDLLTQQRFLYRQLHQLAQKQSSLVDGKDPQMLLSVLANRQRLIDKLADIDRRLQPIRADWQQIAQSLDPAQRHQVQKLVDNVQQILGEILVRDEKDSQKLRDCSHEVSQQLQATSAGKRINKAYAQSDLVPQSRVFDTQSE